MKQTKPYGRAHLTSAEREFLARQGPPPRQFTPAQTSVGQADNPHGAAQAGDSLLSPPARRAKKISLLHQGANYLFVLVVSLSIFVFVRDSLLLARLLEQVSSRESVMVCKEGKMHYPDYNPLDRLLGKGHFICTEWSIQRGMLSIPRPYY